MGTEIPRSDMFNRLVSILLVLTFSVVYYSSGTPRGDASLLRDGEFGRNGYTAGKSVFPLGVQDPMVPAPPEKKSRLCPAPTEIFFYPSPKRSLPAPWGGPTLIFPGGASSPKNFEVNFTDLNRKPQIMLCLSTVSLRI
ncbi:MAG: hypothetical protein V1816_15175 [Pseudomonadota bacterium]